MSRRTVVLVAMLASVMLGFTMLQSAVSEKGIQRPASLGSLPAVAPTKCVYPTGTMNITKATAYNKCRFDEIDAAIAEFPVYPTPTPTPTTPTPTTPTSTTPTPTTPTSTTPTPTTPTSTTPTPTETTSPPSGAFPGADNTGDPSTADNTAYTGPATVSANNVVIDNKRISGELNITGDNVVIRNSTITGNVFFQQSNSGGRIEDSTVINNGHDGAGVNYYNYTALRVEVTGGRVSMSCDTNCTIIDSWLHGQQTQGAWHGDGFLSNGGSGFTLRHNTLACDGPATGSGACSAAVAMYGDWDEIQNVVIDNNLFKASPAGYCMYAGNLDNKPYKGINIDITNNVFERGSNNKCAVYGPYSGRPTDPASTWSGNKWSDGAALN